MLIILVDDVDLPSAVKRVLKERGIRELYPPQVSAIQAGVLNGKSLTLAVPTASGKTLVAELAMLKQVLTGRGKALYLVPLRALAFEKYEEFTKYEELGVKVALSSGDYDSDDPWLAKYDIIVATNEKADSLIRHRASWLEDVRIVVADEVHLLTTPDRGPTLEVTLARLRAVNPELQVLALSATIRNAEEVANWLNSELVVSDWRPVPLKMGVYYGGRVSFNDGTELLIGGSGSPTVRLAVDCVLKGGQVLVFTSTRQNSALYAERIKEHLSPLLSVKERRELEEVSRKILSRSEETRIDRRLAECIRSGVAFHHAGLASEHRRAIEEAFRGFKLKVICATPTLAAGVNLPARRVVIQDYRRYELGLGYRPIPVLEFHQMAGRAGRPQYDKYGEAILIARSVEEAKALHEDYVLSPPERIWSKLSSEPALRSHVLAAIASGFSNTMEGLLAFMEKTFYAYQFGSSSIKPTVERVIRFLKEEGFVEGRGSRMIVTPFGKRTSELYLDPLSAVVIRRWLRTKVQATPIGYLQLICYTTELPKLYLRRGEAKRVKAAVKQFKEELLIEAPDEYEEDVDYVEFLTGLKAALMLYDWIEERSEDYIIEAYGVGSGDIYAIAQTASWVAYSACELAKVIGLKSHVPGLSKLEARLKTGCREELLPLVQLEGVGRVRARRLFEAGYRSLEDLRKAKVEDLVKVPTIGIETAKKIKLQV
ncbi:MAG: ATP-dependent DNA helicase [Candidatus Nezhaarchaeales archaeon]